MGKWSLVFLNPRAAGEFGSTCGRLGSLFRTAPPTLSWGRGLEKVPQTNACPSSVWSTYRGWQIHSHSGQKKGKRKRIILGAWNVRTLLNWAITSRPERGTALIARELQCYWVDMAALSDDPDCGRGFPDRRGRWLYLLLEREAASHQNSFAGEHACATRWNQRAPHESAHPSQQDQIPHNYQRLRPYTYKPRWYQGTIL